MRQKKAWIISGGTLAVLLAASAVVLPPLLDSDPVADATGGYTAVAPDPTRTYAPVTNFYKQAGPPASSPQTPVAPQTLSISRDLVGTQLATSQVGLSLEATDLADPNLNADNESMVQILRGLHKPVLRFGGNAVDRRFFWTSSGEAIPAGYTGDKARPVQSVGPADLERINGMLEAADAYISLSVDLGHYNPSRAADMVKHGAEIFGDRLVAVTIGNEPNGYGDGDLRDGKYTVGQFTQEAEAYAAAMYETAPNVPISGPGTYSANWAQEWIDIPMK